MGAGEGANIISFLVAEFTQRAVKVNILYKLVSSLAEEKNKEYNGVYYTYRLVLFYFNN